MALALLVVLNRCGVKALTPYLLVGLIMWWLVLQSGAHPTIAGVALALTIPLKRSPAAPDDATSPLHRLEHALQPWVAFLVVPVFGFANAGVSFQGMSLQALLAPVSLGVAAGLFLGEQIGVFAAACAVIGLGWADRPAKASLGQLYGVAVLCGVGFTMSLFIGLLAFESEELQEAAKLGVLVGSSLSTVVGWLILRTARPETAAPHAQA